MDSPENVADENRRLRRTMRDLVSLSTLPAVWSGLDIQGIAKSLADVLLNTLALDLVYIRLQGLNDDLIEVVRSLNPIGTEVLTPLLAPILESGRSFPPDAIPDPFRDGTLHLATTRFGFGNDTGILISASLRSDFPTDQDRLLLGVGANQTAIVIQRRRAEERVQKQEELLRVTLASIGDGVLTTDIEGRVTFLNPVAEKLTGWKNEEAVGQHMDAVFEIINEHTRRPVLNPIRTVLREGRVVGLANHTILIARDRTERPIDDSAAPIRNEAGTVSGAVLIFRDITERKNAEASLRAREARYRVLVTATADVVYLMNADWSEMQPLDGRDLVASNDEPIRDWLEKNIPPSEHDSVRKTFHEALTTQQTFELEHRVYHPDGSVGWTFSRAVPILDAAGKVVEWFGTARDITEQKQAKEELARVSAESERRRRLYEAILAGTPDFVYVFSLDYRVLYANDALIAMWGHSLAETIGKTFLEIGYESWHAEMHCREIDQVRTTKQPIRGEVPFNGTNGRRVYDYIFVPVLGADGEVEVVAGTTRDITDRKDMEDELRHLAASLSEADHRKDEFIALLAHELRNPLAPLRNGVQVLRLAEDESTRRMAQEMMDRQLTHMVRLIDDLLDVSRLSRNKMELRQTAVTLDHVIASAVETVRPLIDETGHDLTISLPDQPVALYADLTRLSQVFSNLLTNSAKYMEHGGRIWVSGELHGNEVTVSVRDTGIGIPPQSLAAVFNMFSQVDSSLERSRGGLGIGLALVKGLVEMHGGSVTADSEGEGKGSTFTVTLPVVPEPLDPIQIESAPGIEATPRRRILVVDDNRDSASSMSMMLKLLGNDVQTAHDGIDAVAAAERWQPDVILMDIGMPKLNGFEATRQIREQPWGKRIVIIALTGWGQDDDRAQSRSAGCDGHLVKPVNISDLRQLLTD